MAAEEVKITHIEAMLSTVALGQLATETVADSLLGYKMTGYRSTDDVITKFLCRDLPGILSTLRLSGPTTTGATGLLVHDTNGDVTGGINSIAELETVVGEITSGLAGSGTLNTLAMFTPDGDTVGDSIVTQATDLISVGGETATHMTDGLVTNGLEVNGASYFDGASYFYNSALLQDNVSLYFGSGSDCLLKYHTAQTPDALVLGLGTDSNMLLMGRVADLATDYALGPFTDPTIVLKGAGTTVADRTEVSHGLIHAYAGDVSINANNLLFDSDFDSHTYTGGIKTGLFVCGQDHTIDSQYTSNAAIIGYSNSLNGDAELVSGGDNVVTGSGGVVCGRSITLNGGYNACFGYDHTVDCDGSVIGGYENTEDGSYSACFGRDNDAEGSHALMFGWNNSDVSGVTAALTGGEQVSNTGDRNITVGYYLTNAANLNLVFGALNTVDAAAHYGLTFGSYNENDHAHAIVHGDYCKSMWDHGNFFASAQLDGATVGVSQCFHETMLCRHTESTDMVPLTASGTGTTLPLHVPDGYRISFLLSINAAYEASGVGSRVYLAFISMSNTSADIFRIETDYLVTASNGTYSFQYTWTYDEGNDLVGINVSPGDAAAANIVAHISNGIVLKSEQTATIV